MDITTKARLGIKMLEVENGQPRLRGYIAIPATTKGEADTFVSFTAFGKKNVDGILAHYQVHSVDFSESAPGAAS